MKIAVLTHTFPPTNHGNAKRPFYVVQGLLDAGWQVDVYTSAYGCDGELELAMQHPNLKVEVINDRREQLFRVVKKVPYLSKLCSRLVTGLSWPDVNVSWVKVVSKKLLANNSYDRILAFVFPASMFVASKFDGLVDERWTFDLQESVTPQAKIVNRKSPLYQWKLPQLKAIEKQSLAKAGGVIFTAETNRQAYIDAGIVDEEKTVHIPYFYDESYFQDIEDVKPDDGFNIAYYGTFDWSGSRSPETFLRSFRKFLDAYPEAEREAKFVFYGAWLSEHNKLIEDLNLADNIEINQAISYDQYMKKLATSSVLLLVVSSEHNLFMPSKIVDYFGAQRPVLAYVPINSEMSKVLIEAGMKDFAVAEQDEEKGSLAISELWEMYKKETLEVNTHKVTEWSSYNIIPKYIGFFTS